MTDKELDKLFQQSFSGHQLPVPEDMWQRVNPQKKRKRRIAFWWWSGAGVAALFILISMSVWLSPALSDKNAKPATTSLSLKKTKTTNEQPAIKSEQPEHLSEPISADKSIDSASSLSMQSSEQKEDKSDVSSYPGKQNTEVNRDVAKNWHILPDKSKTIKTGEIANRIDEQVKEKQTAKDSIATTPDVVIKSTVQKTDSATLTAGNTEEKAITEAATPVHVKKIHYEKAAGIELMIAGYNNDRKVYETEKNATPMFVSLGAIDPKVKMVLHSASINVRIDKPVTKNLSFKTGLQFIQTNQRVTYNQESVNQFAIINSLDVNSDTTRFARIHSERPVVKGIYNSINMPLLISYHTNGYNIQAGVSAGVLFNLISWYKGEVPSADYKQTMTAKNTFKQNTGASLYMSLSAVKNWGNWQLFAEPDVQYTLSSLTKTTASFKQKITSYGLGIGIRKSIGKR